MQDVPKHKHNRHSTTQYAENSKYGYSDDFESPCSFIAEVGSERQIEASDWNEEIATDPAADINPMLTYRAMITESAISVPSALAVMAARFSRSLHPFVSRAARENRFFHLF